MAETVFNEGSIDGTDFRIESDGNANMLFVDGSSNRVGVGTSSPAGLLEIENTSGNANVYITSADASNSRLYLGHQSDAGHGFIDYDHDTAMYFGTDGTTRLTILEAGQVGIGTNSPGYLTELRVNDTTTDTPRLVIRQLGTGDSSLAFQMPDSPYGFTMGVDNSDSDKFKISTGVGDVGGTGEKMSIATDGTITFTNTSARFNFYADSDTDIIQYFAGHDTSDAIRIAASVAVATTAASNACDGELIFGTASGNTNTERMRIDSLGNVGIGSSGSNLNARIVRGFSANKGLVIETAQPAIQLVDTDNTGRYFTLAYEQSAKTVYFHNQSNGPIRFDTNEVERWRIEGSGNLVGAVSGQGGIANQIKFVATTNYANGGFIDFTIGSSGAIVLITNHTNDSSALFHMDYNTSTVTLIANPNGTDADGFNNADAGDTIRVTKSSGSFTFRVKNDTGGLKAIGVAVIGCHES